MNTEERNGLVEYRLRKASETLNEVELHIANYDDYIDFSKEDVIELIDPAKELVMKVEKLLKLKNENR